MAEHGEDVKGPVSDYQSRTLGVVGLILVIAAVVGVFLWLTGAKDDLRADHARPTAWSIESVREIFPTNSTM